MLEELLGELLAVIHKDGGQHTARVGVPASVEDAMQEFYRMRATIEELSKK